MALDKIQVVKVPVFDTGLGREAGYANDVELIEAALADRAEIQKLLTAEAYARLEEEEAEMTRRLIGG